MVLVTNAEGKIDYVNDRCCEVSGYSREEILGQTPQLMDSGFHDPEFFKEMSEAALAGKVWRGEVCKRKKSGKLCWVESTHVPLVEKSGKVTGCVVICIDVTARRKAEIALKRSQEQLDVALKGAELAAWEWEVGTDQFSFDTRWGEMLGYKEGELSEGVETWHRLVCPEDVWRVSDVLRAHLEGEGVMYQSEYLSLIHI